VLPDATLINKNDKPIPHAMPSAASFAAWPKTSRATSDGRAPSAILTPISWRRSVTNCVIAA
jgi:hypothetical protein